MEGFRTIKISEQTDLRLSTLKNDLLKKNIRTFKTRIVELLVDSVDKEELSRLVKKG